MKLNIVKITMIAVFQGLHSNISTTLVIPSDSVLGKVTFGLTISLLFDNRSMSSNIYSTKD